VGQAYADSYTSTEREQLRQHLIGPDIFVSKSAAFSTKYLDIYDKYVLSATEGNIDVAKRWHDAPMDFWQNQLNFATWCATTGCGVSVHDHLKGRYDFAPWTQAVHVWRRVTGNRKLIHGVEYSPGECPRPEIR